MVLLLKVHTLDRWGAILYLLRSNCLQNIVVLLELAIICPLNNATVERLFSFMKLVKTKLRSQLRDDTLNKVLRIKTESPDHLEEYQVESLDDSFGEYARSLTSQGKLEFRFSHNLK